MSRNHRVNRLNVRYFIGFRCHLPVAQLALVSGRALTRPSLLLALTLCLMTGHATGETDKTYEVRYQVEFVPEKDEARVSLRIRDAALITKLNFRLDPQLHRQVKANGGLELTGNRAIWTPPPRGARMQWRTTITHARSAGKFDAMMTEDWAIFRGDDLVPPVKVSATRGARSKSYLEFILPQDWHAVNTGWPRDQSGVGKGGRKNAPQFVVDNPDRAFDRPTGWMIAGKLGTRRDLLGNTRVSVSAPVNAAFRRMDVLTLANFVWPEMEKAFGAGPAKVLIIGAGDPMWRGGLSAANSLFLHADRPLVSENGTSTLVHELVHVFTRIRGLAEDDWIAEGLAEFYAIELVYRAGGMRPERRDIVRRRLSEWSKGVASLKARRAKGAVTARAALLFFQLDEEIRNATRGKRDLDCLVRKLMARRKVSFGDLKSLCSELLGRTCSTLQDLRGNAAG